MFRLLCVFKYLYCKSRCHNIKILLQGSFQILVYNVYKTKTHQILMGISKLDKPQDALHALCKCTHQTARCRPPVACARCRTGWARGGFCWKLKFCHNQQCSSSQFPPLQSNIQKGESKANKLLVHKVVQTVVSANSLSARVRSNPAAPGVYTNLLQHIRQEAKT